MGSHHHERDQCCLLADEAIWRNAGAIVVPVTRSSGIAFVVEAQRRGLPVVAIVDEVVYSEKVGRADVYFS